MPHGENFDRKRPGDLLGPFSSLYCGTMMNSNTAPNTKLRAADPMKPGRERAICACCGRTGFLVNEKKGTISRHGFLRPRNWGATTASCPGSDLTPEAALEKAIADATTFEALAISLLDGPLVERTVRELRMKARAKSRTGVHVGGMRRSIARQLRKVRAKGEESWPVSEVRRSWERKLAAVCSDLDRLRELEIS